jgi:tetratricopeptide (TPR) repeat protein
VDWVSALPELLCGVFFFLALLCLFVAEDARRRRLPWMLLSAALTFLALLAKEMAFTLPLLVLLYILLNRSETGNLTRKISLSILPFSLAFVVYLSLRTHALGGLTHVQYPMSLRAFQFFMSDVALVGGYCWKLLVPVRLNAFYVFEPARSPFEWRFLASAAMLAALGLVFWRLRSRRPQAAFLLGLMVLTMLPVLYIGGVGENVFAERYLYIPSLGFCGLWGLVLEMGAKRLKRFGTQLTLGSLALVMLIYSWQTVHRNKDWRDNFTLYYDTVAKSPKSSPMHNALAREYVHRGDFQAAKLQYQQALLVRKENFYSSPLTLYRSLVGMGAIESHIGDAPKAARWVSQALALLPDQPLAYNDFGTVLMQQGRVEKAIEYFQRAVQLGPDSEVYRFNLGLAFLRAGRYAQAREQLENSLQIYPDDPNTWLELGIAQLNLGNLPEAEQSFQRSLDLNPTSKGVHRYLGALYYDQGRFQDSVREFELAVEVAPEDTESAEGLKRAVERAAPR